MFWEREKSNEVVDYYPTISVQETKETNKIIYHPSPFSLRKVV